MRGAGILEWGAIQLLDLPDPEVSEPQQLLIEVQAAGVGNWDDIVRAGNWDVGSTPPMALGVEAAGAVLAIGPGVTRFRVGDEVLTHPLPLPQQGTWAEVLAAREGQVALKPSGMSVAVAGLFPVPALTASQVLSDAVGLSPEETIIVQGAGGITGGMIVALAAGMGGRAYGPTALRWRCLPPTLPSADWRSLWSASGAWSKPQARYPRSRRGKRGAAF